jgi:hypothetical protein
MIVRILGEGQLDVDDDRLDELNKLDNDLLESLDNGHEDAFQQRLIALLAAVRKNSNPVADDHLAPSELILPREDATIDEVRKLLSDDGLIPG